jgi:hypothetical protein
MRTSDKVLAAAFFFGTITLASGLSYFNHREQGPEKKQTYTIELTIKNSAVVYHENVIVNINAPWFGLSNVYKKCFSEFAEQYKGKGIIFANLDFDNGKNTLELLSDRGFLKKDELSELPYTLFIKGGKTRHVSKGGDPAELETKIKEIYLKDVPPDNEKAPAEPWMKEATIGGK